MKTEATPRRTLPFRLVLFVLAFHLLRFVRAVLLVAVTLGVGLLGKIQASGARRRIDAHDWTLHPGRASPTAWSGSDAAEEVAQAFGVSAAERPTDVTRSAHDRLMSRVLPPGTRGSLHAEGTGVEGLQLRSKKKK